jgi:hypothetical protein
MLPESIKVSLIAGIVKQLKKMIQESNKMSLITVNHIIVKKVSLTVSLIAVNVNDYHFHLHIITSKKCFRNRLKCHLLHSIILS